MSLVFYWGWDFDLTGSVGGVVGWMGHGPWIRGCEVWFVRGEILRSGVTLVGSRLGWNGTFGEGFCLVG